jgi:hypothetical protein
VRRRTPQVSGFTAGQVVTDQLPAAIEEFKPTLITFRADPNNIATEVNAQF